MSSLLRYIIFLVVGLCMSVVILFGDLYIENSKTYIYRELITSQNYFYWTKVDGSIYCVEENSEYLKLQNEELIQFIGQNINVVYLTNVDIIQCAKYLENIAGKFRTYNLLLAIDLDKEPNFLEIIDIETNSSKFADYVKKFNEYSNITDWVSYIVINQIGQNLTYLERRSFDLELRNIFKKSFLGYKFDNNIKPTPDNRHPIRPNLEWNLFMSQGKDGDFVISSIPIQGIQKTSIIVDGLIPNFDGIKGQFVYLTKKK